MGRSFSSIEIAIGIFDYRNSSINRINKLYLKNSFWFLKMNSIKVEDFIMKSTGIVRKVDELGRVVIPIELRRLLEIDIKDPLEIYTEEDRIILKKYRPNMVCSVTGDVSNKNIRLADGNIILSPEGAQQLIKEIQQNNLDNN